MILLKSPGRYVELVDVDGLAGLRADVDEVLARNDSCALGADVSLAANELVTNAFDHGRAPKVRVCIEVDDPSTIGLRVEHRDAGVAPDPRAAAMPGFDAISGRGLAIAAMVSSSISRCVDADGLTVTLATFDRR